MGLYERWMALRRRSPGTSSRDAAVALGVTEAELVASGVGKGTLRLQDLRGLLTRLPSLGVVLAITGNAAAVTERQGRWTRVEVESGRGLLSGTGFELRLAPGHWVHGFATHLLTPRGPRPALRFFDGEGSAVHEIQGTDQTDEDAWDRLLAQLASPDQSTGLELQPASAAAVPDGGIPGLPWTGEDRRDALSAAGARQLPSYAAHQVLVGASSRRLPVRVAVGNRGGVQIHTGLVLDVRASDSVLRVVDPDFTLRVAEDRLAGTWQVPAQDGGSPAVALLDGGGRQVVVLSSAHAAGTPEDQAWRGIMGRLDAGVA